jgi:CBS domain-containing protein
MSRLNVAFFLIPKKDVAYLHLKGTMRQAMERMEHHGYTAVPLIDENEKYAGTLTEGDLLWKFKNTPGLTFKDSEKILLKDVPRRHNNHPVRIYATISDLLSMAIDQNFIPVIDDQDVFIGIVRRREIIEYYARSLRSEMPSFT